MDSVRKEKRKNRHLNERFFYILENFVNEYKVAKSHPDIDIYSNKLQNTMDSYKQLEKDIFMQKNHLERLNEETYKRIVQQNKEIDEYKKEVNVLRKNIERLIPIKNSSIGLYDDEVEIYRKIHFEIVAFIIGIFLVSGLTYSTFRKS
jgi:Na+/phosphate symporter